MNDKNENNLNLLYYTIFIFFFSASQPIVDLYLQPFSGL